MAILQECKLKVNGMDKPFDSKLDTVHLICDPYWRTKHYWWFFAEKPEDLEWRLADKTFEVNIEGKWTPAVWIGADVSNWVRITRTSDYLDAFIQITDGKVTDSIYCLWDRDDSVTSYATDVIEYHKVMGTTRTGEGRERMPVFSPEQVEILREKISKRYLEAAREYILNSNRIAKMDMNFNAARLQEIGFDPPEHDFEKPAPLVVPIYHHDGAFFITDPDQTCDGGGHCECALCSHSQSDYENGDSCGCDNCCDNIDHWHKNGANPDHCNFCKEFAKHIGNDEED